MFTLSGEWNATTAMQSGMVRRISLTTTGSQDEDYVQDTAGMTGLTINADF
jgi:hypothetical protein